MTFEEIMMRISSGLTGNPNQDIPYLREQAEYYKNSAYSKEVLRACGRLIYQCLPDEKRDTLQSSMNKTLLGINSVIEEANFNIYKGNNEKAEQMLEKMVAHIESSHMYEDDSINEYHSFTEIFQKMLFDYYNQPKKELREVTEPFSELYLAYGSCLHGLGKYRDALSILEKALRWNPADVRILFEYGETWKRLGDLDQFFALNKTAFRYAFHSKDVARCCRNAAYYFVEKKSWPAAVGYLLCSQIYDRDNPSAGSELYYIQHTAGDSYREPSLKEMENISHQYDIPFGASEEVIYLAYNYAKMLLSNGKFDTAEYFARIAADLTDSSEAKRLLQRIQAEATPYQKIDFSGDLLDYLDDLKTHLLDLYEETAAEIETSRLSICFTLAWILYKKVCSLETLPVQKKDFDPGNYPVKSFSYQLACIMMNLELSIESGEQLNALNARDPELLKKEIADKAFVKLGRDLFVDFSVQTIEDITHDMKTGLHESLLRVGEIERLSSIQS